MPRPRQPRDRCRLGQTGSAPRSRTRRASVPTRIRRPCAPTVHGHGGGVPPLAGRRVRTLRAAGLPGGSRLGRCPRNERRDDTARTGAQLGMRRHRPLRPGLSVARWREGVGDPGSRRGCGSGDDRPACLRTCCRTGGSRYARRRSATRR